jgi:methylmalonyl-CoA/ethylmalonyl-CoA epimerase
MAMNTAKSSPFANLMHIGIIVKGVDGVIERLESFNFGKFEPMTAKPAFENEPEEQKVKGFMSQIGDVEVEVFEPFFIATPWQEFIETKGQGIHHLGFLVDDLDKEVAELAKRGWTAQVRGKSENLEWVDYAVGIGGITFQLLQRL